MAFRPPAFSSSSRSSSSGDWLVVRGARQNNLKNIDVPFPLGALSVVTGVSGSGKSSLVNEILYPALARSLHRAQVHAGAFDSIDGVEAINKVIRVDQQPLGQTPTSNPATYTGVFELIRELFAQIPDAKLRGYSPRRFSFNVPGGRCEKCEGAGQLKIEMHFLPDVWIQCDVCNGKRYDRQTLDINYHGYSIADVLEMSCESALELFKNIPGIRRVLKTLCDVGLGYLALGQAAPTLSGGEAQRVKLASELARPDTGRTLYLLDEPTTGLHFDDLQRLLDVLHRLVDLGNTAIVIEHNLDVIKNADWIVDLGPEAGNDGGFLVFAGTPEELITNSEQRTVNGEQGTEGNKNATSTTLKKTAKKATRKTKKEKTSPPESGSEQGNPHCSLFTVHCSLPSHTATALAPILAAGPFVERRVYDSTELFGNEQGDVSIQEVGEGAKMPWEVDGPRWHTKDRVSRTGQPIRWDGNILKKIVQRIEATNAFAPTDWNNRSVVEIRGEKKSLGWFFHALTSDEWLLRMKFRTARNTFRKETLIPKLDLKPLNEMDEIPLYGTEPRVRVQRLNGPWQEIELKVHSMNEVDRPEFWEFLDLAIKEFAKYTKKAEKSPNELMPWKIMGEKWHFLPKGLVGGDKLLWDLSLLKEIFGILKEISPDARVVWTNKVLVPVYLDSVKRKVEGRVLPWVVVHTKRVDGVYLEVYVGKNAIPLGRIRSLGADPFVDGEKESYDVVQLKFSSFSNIHRDELKKILEESKSSVPGR